MWKTKKALSPVVASIILIAVTVAVSMAVAAWMGVLTSPLFDNSKPIKIEVPNYENATYVDIQDEFWSKASSFEGWHKLPYTFNVSREYIGSNIQFIYYRGNGLYEKIGEQTFRIMEK